MKIPNGLPVRFIELHIIENPVFFLMEDAPCMELLPGIAGSYYLILGVKLGLLYVAEMRLVQ